MPTPTDITIEESFSVADAVDVAPPGSTFEAYIETGVTQLGEGDQVHEIVFNTQKAALSYILDELVVFNEVDASPIVLGYIETAKTVDGFQLTTSAVPDTGNYYARWKVRIPTTVVEGAVVATPSTGAVTEVTAVGQDGIHATVANAATAPTITMSLTDGGIDLSKLAEDVLVDDGTVATKTGAQTLTNKSMDGANNTFTNIGLGALSGNGIIAQGLADPSADRTLFWDDSAAGFDFVDAPFLYSVTERGLITDVYISSRTSGAGTGTADDPFDGSTTAKLDAILANNSLTPVNTRIHFGEGTFTTKGNLTWVPRTGWKMYLTPLTTIRYDVLTAPNVAALASGPGICGRENSGTLIEDFLIDGGTWDLNQVNQVNLSGGAFAVAVICDGFTVRNAKFINFGNPIYTGELFLVCTFSRGNINARIHSKGVLIENCEFTLPAAVTHAGTITLVAPCAAQDVVSGTALSVGWFRNVVVRDCYFHDITPTTAPEIDCINLGGWVQDIHCHNNRFVNISGSNSRDGYYHDTGAIVNCTLENDTFRSVSNPIAILNGGNVIDNVYISNEVATDVIYAGIRVNGHASVHSNNVTVSNCHVQGATAIQGIGGPLCDSLRLRNNTIDVLSNYTETTGATVLENFNNRKEDGTAVSSIIPLAVEEGGTGTTSGLTQLYDLAGTPKLSVDIDARKLYDTDGTTVVADWDARTLFGWDAGSGLVVHGGALTLNASATLNIVALDATNTLVFDNPATLASDRHIGFDDVAGTMTIRVAAPANAGSTGVAGTWAYDSSYLYIATGTSTWKRVAIATWP